MGYIRYNKHLYNSEVKAISMYSDMLFPVNYNQESELSYFLNLRMVNNPSHIHVNNIFTMDKNMFSLKSNLTSPISLMRKVTSILQLNFLIDTLTFQNKLL
jgi:hypothetical protein